MAEPVIADSEAIIEMLVQGLAYDEIKAALRVGSNRLDRHLKLLTPDQIEARERAKRARNLKMAKATSLSPAERQAIIDLLPICESLKIIASIIGCPPKKITRFASPIIEQGKLDGTLPPCSCGRPRFHRHVCSSRTHATARLGPHDDARVEEMTRLIMSGLTFDQIGKRVGCGRKTAAYYLRYLTPAQRELRLRIEATRIRYIENVVASRPHSDALWSRIHRMLPRWLEPHQQDDVISDIYLRVLEGDIEVSALNKQMVKKVASRVTTDSGKYAPLSLDDRLNSDSDRTFADMLEDPSALAAFDRIFESPSYE